MKKIITILFIIMLLLTIVQIRNTYALYKAQISGDYQSLLGVWSVKVNNTDLSSGNADMTFEITDDYVHFVENEYVYGNSIAPGSEGYFDILIDPTGSDVSVRYNIHIGDSIKIRVDEEIFQSEVDIPIEVINVEDTFVKGEEIDSDTEHINYVDLSNNTASGVIPLSVIEEGYSGRVRVYFKWIDDETKNSLDTMLGNDEIGTNLGLSTGSNEIDAALIDSEAQPSIVLSVDLELVQYMGEELAPVTTP